MPRLQNYPFKTLKVIDGREYIEVSELNEILENLEKLGPVLKQVADASLQLRQAFSDGKSKTDNLLVEMQKAAGND